MAYDVLLILATGLEGWDGKLGFEGVKVDETRLLIEENPGLNTPIWSSQQAEGIRAERGSADIQLKSEKESNGDTDNPGESDFY